MHMELEADEVMDYLYELKSTAFISASFFDFTIHGMRYASKMRKLPYTQFALPDIKLRRRKKMIQAE